MCVGRHRYVESRSVGRETWSRSNQGQSCTPLRGSCGKAFAVRRSRRCRLWMTSNEIETTAAVVTVGGSKRRQYEYSSHHLACSQPRHACNTVQLLPPLLPFPWSANSVKVFADHGKWCIPTLTKWEIVLTPLRDMSASAAYSVTRPDATRQISDPIRSEPTITIKILTRPD